METRIYLVCAITSFTLSYPCHVCLRRKCSHPSPRLLGRSGLSPTQSRLFRNASPLECQVGIFYLHSFAMRLTLILLVYHCYIHTSTNANSGDFAVARFDFSWMDAAYHQETLDNLRKAVQNVKKLCPVSWHFFSFNH